jgi:hypothetical protein
MDDKGEKNSPEKNSPKKDVAKFDWVTERSSCSLPKVFQSLRLQVEEDVKTRNGLRPDNSPYEFSVKADVADFTVFLQAKDLQTSVKFRLSEHAISVWDDKGNPMFEVTPLFTDDGECSLTVNGEKRDFWQVRRMALDDLFFHGY